MVTKLMLFKIDPRGKTSFKRESLLILTNLTISTIMLAPLITSRKNKKLFSLWKRKGTLRKITSLQKVQVQKNPNKAIMMYREKE
jgi:hypothetical protein